MITPEACDPATAARLALDHLRLARDYAAKAGSQRTLARIRLAIASAGGAVRHAEGKASRHAP